MTNKYFKGKVPNKKISFKAEQINQIQYYLACLQKDDDLLKNDFVQTADEDFYSLKLQ